MGTVVVTTGEAVAVAEIIGVVVAVVWTIRRLVGCCLLFDI